MGQALPIISAVVSAVGTAYAANEQKKAQLAAASQSAAKRREGQLGAPTVSSQRFAVQPGSSQPGLVGSVPTSRNIDMTETPSEKPVVQGGGPTPHQTGMRDANATATVNLEQQAPPAPRAQDRPLTLSQAVGGQAAPAPAPPRPQSFAAQPVAAAAGGQAPQQAGGSPTIADILRLLQARNAR
jgi:hypothetical protein